MTIVHDFNTTNIYSLAYSMHALISTYTVLIHLAEYFYIVWVCSAPIMLAFAFTLLQNLC